MNLFLFALIENVVTLIATVLICWVTSSPWGMLCLLNINTGIRKKDEKKEETHPHD